MARAHNTILIRVGEGAAFGEAPVATAVIQPGMLIQRLAAGTVEPEDTGEVGVQCLIARENVLEGKTLDDTYAVGSRCLFVEPRQGDRINVLLTEGSGAGFTYAVGDEITPTGDGTFKKKDAAGEVPYGKLQEALDLDDASAPGHAIAEMYGNVTEAQTG